MKEQLHEAWRTNNTINFQFVEWIDEEGMKKTLSTRGGRTVYEQLFHLYNVRMQWLEIIAKDIFKKYKRISRDEPYSKELLFELFENSGKSIEEFIDKSWENNGKVVSFKKGLIPFVSYLIAHEGHHRGSIY